MITIIVQLKYSLQDIFSNKFKYLLLILQITLSLIIFTSLLKSTYKTFDFKAKVNTFNKYDDFDNMYMLYDITDENKFFSQTIYEPDILNRQLEFYNFLKTSSSFKVYNVYNDNIIFSENNIIPQKYSLDKYDENLLHLNSLKVDSNFFEFFELDLSSGNLFSDDNYSSIDELIPVILGHDFKNLYDLGDIFIDYYNNKYKIIGFLDESSFYFNFQSTNKILYLSQTIISPIQINKFTEPTMYDAIINRSYIYTKNRKDLIDIEKKSHDLNLYTYYNKSFTEQLTYINDDLNSQLSIVYSLFSLLAFFSITSIISNIFRFIDDYIFEFSVHILSGASLSSLIKRVSLQIIIILIFCNILNLVISKFNLASIISILYSLLVFLLVTLFIYIKFKNTNINIFLRCKK